MDGQGRQRDRIRGQCGWHRTDNTCARQRHSLLGKEGTILARMTTGEKVQGWIKQVLEVFPLGFSSMACYGS